MQKRLFLTPAAIIAFILYFTIFGDRGLLRINHLHRDRDEMQKRFLEVKGENDKLKREIAALQSDRRYLESIARRDFGLVRGNEVIYQFPPLAAGGDKAGKKVEQKGDRKAEQPPAAVQPPADAGKK
jgi:cell division protein FtsB